VVESQFGFHVIKLEEKREATQGGGAEEVHARHILIRYPAAPETGGMPMSLRDRARASVAEEKRDRALDELAVRHRVSVAENYVVGISVIAPVLQPDGSTLPTS